MQAGAHIIEQSAKGIDPTAGPAKDDAVPPRILALLRKQLDAIVAEWVRDNTSKAATAEAQHVHSAWAQTVLDQAKRLQERKRPAASTAEAANSLSKSTPVEPPPAAFPATQLDIPPTQLDGTPETAPEVVPMSA